MVEKRKDPMINDILKPNFDAAIRGSKDDTKWDYYSRMDASAQRATQPMAAPVPVPTSTTERSLQTTPDGGNKQVVKTTTPFGQQDWSKVPGARNAPVFAQPAQIEGGTFGGPFEADAGGLWAPETSQMKPGPGTVREGIANIGRFVSSVIPGNLAVPGSNAPPTPQPVQSVIPTPPPPVLGGDTRQRGVTQVSTAGPVPTLQSQFGIMQAPLGGGGTQFTLPNGQGVMNVSPVTPSTMRGDELARQEVGMDLRRELETQNANQQMLNQEAVQRARSDEAMQTLEMQKAAGVVPRQGMAEYEQAAQRMRDEAARGDLSRYPSGRRALGGVLQEQARGTEARKEQYLKGMADADVARSNALSKGATNALEQQKLGLDVFKAGREAKYQDAQIAKWAQDMGNSDYDRQIRQAKNSDEAAQINLTFGRQAIESEFSGQDEAAKTLMLTNQEAGTAEMNRIAKEKSIRFEALSWKHPTVGVIKNLPTKDGNVPVQWNGKDWIRYQAQGVVQ